MIPSLVIGNSTYSRDDSSSNGNPRIAGVSHFISSSCICVSLQAVIADKSGCDTAFFPRIDDDLRSQMFLFLPEAFMYSSSFTLLIQMWRKKCISTQKLISFRWLPLCTRCPFLPISFTSIPQHWNDSLRSEWFCLLFPHRLLVMSL